MAVILPGAGDYESALRMMGEANAIDAFAEGRERSVRMQGELQRQALQRQAAEQREDEINRKQALESAGFTEEMLASALSGGGGGATGGGGRRRASSAGPALDYEAASLQEALAADTAEAQAASTQRMRELDAAQMALAKQLPAQAALEGEVDAGAARQRLLSGPPSYTASRMEQAELEALPADPVNLRGGGLRAARLASHGLGPEIDRAARVAGVSPTDLARALELRRTAGTASAHPSRLDVDLDREDMLRRLELGGVSGTGLQSAIDRVMMEDRLLAQQGPGAEGVDIAPSYRVESAIARGQRPGAAVDVSPEYAKEVAWRESGRTPATPTAMSLIGSAPMLPGDQDVAYQRLRELDEGGRSVAIDALRGRVAPPAPETEGEKAATELAYMKSGSPALARAIEAMRVDQERPPQLSDPEYSALKRQRAGYSKLLGQPFRAGDEEVSPKMRLYRKDELKASREELIAAGAQAVTNTLGQEEYWLPEGAEFTLAKSGPVDDTAEGEGFLQGRLASANKRLSEQTTKTNTLRSAVRRLKKKSGDQLVNPWERFGKPATFMPSIRATSFAVQRAKDGDPSLISQMIGRQLYPSELRDLERLTSNYQDFAGGVRAKATDITKSRKTAAQEAADKEAMGISTKYASLATGLVAGSKMGGMSQEDMDTFSDTIGAIATKDPKTAMEIAKLYTQMNNKERELSIKASKNRGTGPGGIGDRVARTEHRNWTKMLNGVEDDIRNSLMKRDKELVMWVSDKKGPDGTPMLKKNAPPGVKTMYKNAKAGLGGLLRQRADHLEMVNKYATVLGLGAAATDSGDAGDSEEEKVAAFVERMKGLKREGGDGSLHDAIAEAGDAELQKWRDGIVLTTSNPRLVDAAIASIRSAKTVARGGEPAPPVDMKRIPLTKEERAAQRVERARLAEEERRGEAERAAATGLSLAKRINDGEDVTLSEVRKAVEAMKQAPSEESEVILQELDAYNQEKIDRLVDAEAARTRLLSPR